MKQPTPDKKSCIKILTMYNWQETVG
jgi:hypothetical protein